MSEIKRWLFILIYQIRIDQWDNVISNISVQHEQIYHDLIQQMLTLEIRLVWKINTD